MYYTDTHCHLWHLLDACLCRNLIGLRGDADFLSGKNNPEKETVNNRLFPGSGDRSPGNGDTSDAFIKTLLRSFPEELKIANDGMSLCCQSLAEAQAYLNYFFSLPCDLLRYWLDPLVKVLERAEGEGVRSLMIPAVGHFEGLRNVFMSGALLSSLFSHEKPSGFMLYHGVGVHPFHAGEFNQEKLYCEYKLLSGFSKNSGGGVAEDLFRNIPDAVNGYLSGMPAVFVGEIGIDKRVVESVPLDVQKYAFREQLIFAREHDLFVNIHGVGGDNEILHCLKEIRGVRGIIHAYTRNADVARQYIKHGLLLGIGPMLAAHGAKAVREALRYAGPQHIVLETDYPYMHMTVPLSETGADCGKNQHSCHITASPDKIPVIAAQAAAIMEIPPPELLRSTDDNIRKLVSFSG